MAAAGPRSRTDRVLEEQGVAAGERDQIDRAVQAAVRAGVREREATALVSACLEGGFSTPQLLRVLSLISQLALERLPTEGFEAKIGEGIAKGADPDKVLQVAERRALMLNRARSLLNGILLEGLPVSDRDELIPDVAAALEDGGSADEIRRMLVSSFEAGEGVGEIRRKLFP